MKNSDFQYATQSGGVLIIMVFILAIAGMAALFSTLDGTDVKIVRDQKTLAAMVEAKAALIGFAIGTPLIEAAGYLPNPDFHVSPIIPEGSETGTVGLTDISAVGKFPWYSLGTSPLKDGWNECLWYVVSGRYKNNPKTLALNWDTLGQIDVIDSAGNVLANNLPALIVSSGTALGGQDRSLAETNVPNCGGGYDAKNYLDTYDAGDAVAGEVNYFAGSTKNRLAPDTANKIFILAKNDHYNDYFTFITVDEIFKPIYLRSDFAVQVTALLADAYFQTVIIAGNKGIDYVNCTMTANPTFCNNWKEMLLLVKLSTPSPITIDSATTASCNRVLVFGGRKATGQSRITGADKDNPENYLEGVNLNAFNTPSNNFNGISVFDSTNPAADVLRCIV